MTSDDVEKAVEELQISRDYTALMELAQFDEEETTRNMALFAIGKLCHDENDEAVIDRTVDFLSQAIHQDLFPTSFGEFESFSPFGYVEGGTFSMAAAQLSFLPQWNEKYQIKNVNDILFSIAKENNSQSVQLSCATALLFLEDKRGLEFFERNLNSLERDQDYRHRTHCLFAVGWFWNQFFPDDSTSLEERTQLVIRGMTPFVEYGVASLGWQTEVQWAGANSLGWMGDRRVFPILESLAKRYPDTWFEDDVILAMGRLRDPRAEPYLQKLIDGQGKEKDDVDAADIVKFMRGIDSNSNIEEAKEMISQLDGEIPSDKDSYHIDYSILDGVKLIETGGPMQDQFRKDMADGKIFGGGESPESASDDLIEFTPEQIKRLYAGKDPFGDDYQEDEI
ncbi:MAG TPA: HEAT repeat domain-containing protein [Flavobacteriales bacterium]|nr:HEAT repeat domain-containing protein [Flavobacteriales bacterium]